MLLHYCSCHITGVIQNHSKLPTTVGNFPMHWTSNLHKYCECFKK
nr:hypothetical protein Iba_chr12fCG2340 [Ipomoea batatas]